MGAPRARGAGGRSRQAQALEAGTCPARRPEAQPRGVDRLLGCLRCKAPSRCGGAELGGQEGLQGHGLGGPAPREKALLSQRPAPREGSAGGAGRRRRQPGRPAAGPHFHFGGGLGELVPPRLLGHVPYVRHLAAAPAPAGRSDQDGASRSCPERLSALPGVAAAPGAAARRCAPCRT